MTISNDRSEYELIYSLRRFEDSLEEALGREPSDEEIAIQMDLPAWRVAQLRHSMNNGRARTDLVRQPVLADDRSVQVQHFCR